MENWCYDRKTLFGFAKHYATGEPLPEDLFQKVKAAKNFHGSFFSFVIIALQLIIFVSLAFSISQLECR